MRNTSPILVSIIIYPPLTLNIFRHSHICFYLGNKASLCIGKGFNKNHFHFTIMIPRQQHFGTSKEAESFDSNAQNDMESRVKQNSGKLKGLF